jgi:hypothetical protein
MKDTNKNIWAVVIRIVIAVATALLGVVGGAEAVNTIIGQ